MQAILKYKKWIIGAVIFIIAFILYGAFFGGSNDNNGDLLTSSVNGAQRPADVVGAEIIGALNQIESLRLDRSIFDDAVYRSLRDQSQQIPPEPVGKANPFDPIGAGTAQGTTNNRQTVEAEEGQSGRVIPGDPNNTGPAGQQNVINTTTENPPVI